MYRILILFCILSTQQMMLAQEMNRGLMDSFMHYLDVHNQAMGSVFLSKNTLPIYNNTIGLRNNNTKANEHTQYEIGSISKIVCSVIIHQMAEEHLLNLNDRLSQYFPEIPSADKITLCMMLTHRSGLFNFTNDSNYNQWHIYPQSQNQIINRIISSGIQFPPDSTFQYSNSNYYLLASVAEKILNRPYDELVRLRISEPLGLDHTFALHSSDPFPNQSDSYTLGQPNTVMDRTHYTLLKGAGDIVSTGADMVKFMNGLFYNKLLLKSSLDRMQHFQPNGYGEGLMKVPFYNLTAAGHNGGIDGYRSMAYFFEGDSTAFVLLQNAVGTYSINDMAIGVLSIYYGRKYEFPIFQSASTSYSAPSGLDLSQFVGDYKNAMLNMNIRIYRQGSVLMAQATGQSSFQLYQISESIFLDSSSTIRLEFNLDNGTFTLLQNGGKFEFSRK